MVEIEYIVMLSMPIIRPLFGGTLILIFKVWNSLVIGLSAKGRRLSRNLIGLARSWVIIMISRSLFGMLCNVYQTLSGI